MWRPAKSFIYKVILSFALSLLLFVSLVFAQIKLDNVAKFEFIAKGYILSGYYQKVEVIPEEGKWKDYHVMSHFDLDRKKNNDKYFFMKDVPQHELSALLNSISRADTGVNSRLFSINKNTLMHNVDSLYPHLKPKQRAEVLKAVRSEKTTGQAAAYQVQHPFTISDASYYFIFIITKANDTVKVTARSAHSLFHFPWIINKAPNYNPNITFAFERLLGNMNYEHDNDKWFHIDVARYLFNTHFATRFAWEDLRTDYPASYNIIKDTFTPATMSYWETSYTGLFHSSLLPGYVYLREIFRPDDTLNFKGAKRYEDTLSRIFKKDNFLFRSFKSMSGIKVIFARDEIGPYWPDLLRSIKTVYPDIVNYGSSLMPVLQVTGKPETESIWVILPDNTLLLCRFRSIAAHFKGASFMGIKSALDNYNDKNYQQSVCIHFDASGKVIHDYGTIDGGFN